MTYSTSPLATTSQRAPISLFPRANLAQHVEDNLALRAVTKEAPDI